MTVRVAPGVRFEERGGEHLMVSPAAHAPTVNITAVRTELEGSAARVRFRAY